jgi:hypothetical protein
MVKLMNKLLQTKRILIVSSMLFYDKSYVPFWPCSKQG